MDAQKRFELALAELERLDETDSCTMQEYRAAEQRYRDAEDALLEQRLQPKLASA